MSDRRYRGFLGCFTIDESNLVLAPVELGYAVGEGRDELLAV